MEENKKTEKLSYEQLESAASQISMQLQQARQQISQMSSVLTKLPYLFKVVELGDKYFSTEFVVKCATEVEDILKSREEEVTDEKA